MLRFESGASRCKVRLSEREYGPLQVLRFTTGAMLVYSGAMNIAVYRAIRAGQRWAVGVGAATSLLFWLYLFFLLAFTQDSSAADLSDSKAL